MKVKLSQIISTQTAYSKLLEQFFLPVEIRKTLTKDMRKITTELDDFNKLQQGLFEKHKQTQPSGKEEILPGTKNMSSYMEERQKLLDTEIELLTERFSENLLLDDQRSTMSPKEIYNLGWLIYGDDEIKGDGKIENGG